MLDTYESKRAVDQEALTKNILIQVAFTLNGTIAVLITMFLKFHIQLALSSKTTIENLEKQNKPYRSEYDLGSVRNWAQIFGVNPWLWPLPTFGGSGKPLGDGIYWPKRD